MQLEIYLPSDRTILTNAASATIDLLSTHPDLCDRAVLNVVDQTEGMPQLVLYPNSRIENILEQYGNSVTEGLMKIRIDNEPNLKEAYDLCTALTKNSGKPLNVRINGNYIEMNSEMGYSDFVSAICQYQKMKHVYGDFVLSGFGNVISLSFTAHSLAQHYNRNISFYWEFGGTDSKSDMPTDGRTLIVVRPDETIEKLITRILSKTRVDVAHFDSSEHAPKVTFSVPSYGELAVSVIKDAVSLADHFTGKKIYLSIDGNGMDLDLSMYNDPSALLKLYADLLPQNLHSVRIYDDTEFKQTSEVAIELAKAMGGTIQLSYNSLMFKLTGETTTEELCREFFRKLSAVSEKEDGKNVVHIKQTNFTVSDLLNNALSLAKMLDCDVCFGVRSKFDYTLITNVYVNPSSTARDIAIQIAAAEG